MSGTRWFFGFGSLANDHTLPSDAVWQPASLSGWQRTWGHIIMQDPPWFALHAKPCAQSSIDGLLIRESAELAVILARRERGYRPRALQQRAISRTLPKGDTAWIWCSDSPGEQGSLGCLLQSYIDCVLAGFHRHFGTAGVRQFILTTTGWQNPIIADRGAPRYPRAQPVEPAQAAFFDIEVSRAQARARRQELRRHV